MLLPSFASCLLEKKSEDLTGLTILQTFREALNMEESFTLPFTFSFFGTFSCEVPAKYLKFLYVISSSPQTLPL